MNGSKSENIKWHHGLVSRDDREKRNKNKGVILWYTGLSGCGKSTISNAVEKKISDLGHHTYVLDGDNIRFGLNSNLGFLPEDRTENIRRIGEVARLFVDAGIVISTAFISPYREDRDGVRGIVNEGDMIEIFVKCDLEICEQRDVKGLYKKARAGEIPEFTGISAPYEEPEDPELVIDSAKHSVEECANMVIDYLKNNNYIFQ